MLTAAWKSCKLLVGVQISPSPPNIYRGMRGFTVRSHKPDRVGSIPTPATIYWRVADLAKHVIVNHAYVGSNPSAPANSDEG